MLRVNVHRRGLVVKRLMTWCNPADSWHQQVYLTAAAPISALLQDKGHYMHNQLETVELEYKLKALAPKGRVEILQRLSQRTPSDGQHQWLVKGSGVQCQACGMNIKASSTHSEIEKKENSICAGVRSKTLTQIMQAMVDDSAQKPDEETGHRWTLRSSTFSCLRCWAKGDVASQL